MKHYLFVFALCLCSVTNTKVVVHDTTIPYTPSMAFGANIPNYANARFMREHGSTIIKQTGVQSIRWPGGSYANKIIWDNDFTNVPYFKQFSHDNAGWTFTWKDTAAFAKQNSLEVFWQMNAAVGFIYGADVAARIAANFVGNMTHLGYKVNYIEVGNENYGPWEVPYKTHQKNVTATAYGTICLKMINAIKAVDPTTKVGCVGLVQPAKKLVPHWMRDVLGIAGEAMDFTIIHSYFDKHFGHQDPSYADLLNYGCIQNSTVRYNCGPIAIAQAVKEAVKKHSQRTVPLPIAMTEWNMEQPYSEPSQEMVEGLFTAKYLAQSLTTGGSKDGGVFANTYFELTGGRKYDMLSKSLDIAYGGFYAYAMFKFVAKNGACLSWNTEDHNLTVAAFRHSDSSYGVILINTDTVKKQVQLSGPWKSPSGHVEGFSYSGSSMGSKTYQWNNVGPHGGQGGPYPIDNIPPLHLPFRSGTVALPAGTILGLLLPA